MSSEQPQRDEQPPIGRRLGTGDCVELASHLADLSRLGVPLPDGLRALAAELPRRRLGARMKLMAARLERGEPLEALVIDPAIGLPRAFGGLVLAGVRSGHLPEVLGEFINHERMTSQLRQGLVAALAYPVTLLALLGAWLLFIMHYVLPPLLDMTRDGLDIFESFSRPSSNGLLASPRISTIEWVAAYGPPVLYSALGLIVLVAMLVRLGIGRAGFSHLLSAIPLVGPVRRDCGLAECADLLSLLVGQNTPAPAALRLAAGAVHDPALAQSCRLAAVRSESGMAMAQAADVPGFPPTMLSMVAWGERTHGLAQALRAAGEMFRARAQLYSALMKSVLPPIVFIVIALVAVTVLGGLMVPMLRMMQNLM